MHCKFIDFIIVLCMYTYFSVNCILVVWHVRLSTTDSFKLFHMKAELQTMFLFFMRMFQNASRKSFMRGLIKMFEKIMSF